MERLGESPSAPLSIEQKSALKAIDDKYTAKLAEREIFLGKQLQEALANNNHNEAMLIQREMQDTKIIFEEDKEKEKDRIRKEGREQ